MDLKNKYYYTYVLHSKKDGKNYIGYTHNLLLRFEQHIKGEVYPVKFTEYLTGVKSTRHRRPLELIYFEACLNQEDAIKREKYFKTHYGRMFIKKRLQNYYNKN